MKKLVIYISIALIFFIFGFYFAGRSGKLPFNFKLFAVERTMSNGFYAEFAYYNGSKSFLINAKETEKLKLNIDAHLKKGDVLVKLTSPNGIEIFKKIIKNDVKESCIVLLPSAGAYRVEIIFKGAGGKISIRWQKIEGV